MPVTELRGLGLDRVEHSSCEEMGYATGLGARRGRKTDRVGMAREEDCGCGLTWDTSYAIVQAEAP